MTEQMEDTIWEGLGIANDFMFCKVMLNKDLCKELLQLILPELVIDHIEYPEAQKGIRPDNDAKSVRLDVYASDGHAVYDLEMQVVDTAELPKRTRYYQSMIDLQLIDKGQTYSKLKPSFVIFICPFDLFGKMRHIYTFRNYCKEDKNICLEDETTKIFLNAKGTMDDVSDDLRAFLDYVAGGKPQSDFVRRLEEEVKKARKNREWRHEYMTLMMRDQLNVEKGIAQGIEQGREQGIFGAVSVLRRMGISDEMILEQIQEEYDLSLPEAERFLSK